MGRAPKQTCSACGKATTIAATRSDGGGGRRCKEDCAPKGTPAPSEAEALPGSEVMRTLTLPMDRAAPADDRGTCAKCGEKLTPENSSKLPSGGVVHVDPACRERSAEVPLEHSIPCGACDAERGEACAWVTPEPASHVHPVRIRLLSEDQRYEITRRATADRIRALCDHYAGLASTHPMPTREAIVRAITSDGTSVTRAEDVFSELRGRDELVVYEGEPRYYRRAAGSAPVAMGRVGVKVAPAKRPSMLDIAMEHAEAVLSLPTGEDAPEPHGSTSGEPPPAGVVPCEACDPYGGGCDHEGEPGHRAAPVYDGEAVRACLASEVRERAAVEQLDAVQRARDQLREQLAHARPLSAPQRQKIRERFRLLRIHAADRADLVARVEAFRTGLGPLVRDLATASDSDLIAAAFVRSESAQINTAKDLARLAQAEAADRADEVRELRDALVALFQEYGGTDVPAENDDLIRATIDRVMMAIHKAYDRAASSSRPARRAAPPPPTDTDLF